MAKMLGAALVAWFGFGSVAFAGPQCDALKAELDRVRPVMAERLKTEPGASDLHRDMSALHPDWRNVALAEHVVNRGDEDRCAFALGNLQTIK